MSDDACTYEIGHQVEADFKSKGQYFPGKVSRQHRNGTYTITYDDGDLEKYVPGDRIRQVDKKSPKFLVDDAVEVLDADDDEDEQDEFDWRQAKVTKIHSNGTTYSVEYGDGETETRVDQKRIRKAKSSKDKIKFKVGEKVQVTDGDIWYDACIHAIRRNGSVYDIIHDDDGEIETKVKASNLRRYLKSLELDEKVTYIDQKQKKHLGVIRKLRKDGTYDIEHDSDDETVGKKIARESIQEIRRVSSRFDAIKRRLSLPKRELKVDTKVKFKDSTGKNIIGCVIKVRENENTVDIEHDSDEGTVSKKIPQAQVEIYTAPFLANAIPESLKGFTLMSKSLNVDDKVIYKDDEGAEHNGIVSRVRKNNAYDIEHDSDDEHVAKKVDKVNIRLRNTMTEKIKSKIAAAATISSVPLEKGASVSFKKNDQWTNGYIKKRRKDGTYDIEYVDEDEEHSIAKKIIRSDIRIAVTDQSKSFVTGAVVEITEKRGSGIHVATIIRVNRDGTFKVKYEDGDTEKNVEKTRMKMSSTKLRIGQEIDYLVETPIEGVRRERGIIEWVHRDEKVVVRTEKDDNIFSCVERCEVTMPGDPTGASGIAVSFTRKELALFLLNFGFEVIVYAWFAFGVAAELSDAFTVLRETSQEFVGDPAFVATLYESVNISACTWNTTTTIPEAALHIDRKWLLGLSIGNLTGVICFVMMTMYLTWSKILMLQDGYIDYKEKERALQLQRIVASIMLGIFLVSFASAVCYSSMLNKFGYFCLWDGFGTDTFQIDSMIWQVNPFTLRTSYTTLIDRLGGVIYLTSFNLFRGLTLFIVIHAGQTLKSRIIAAIPAIGITALVSLKSVAVFHLFHYVQRVYVSTGDFGLNQTLDFAILLILLTHWMNVIVFRLLSSAREYNVLMLRHDMQGEISTDVLELAERGEFGVQAKKESKLERQDIAKRTLGPWKSAILSLHQGLVFHLSVVVVSLAINSELQSALLKKSTSWTKHATIDLIMSIVWLIGLIIVPCIVTHIRKNNK